MLITWYDSVCAQDAAPVDQRSAAPSRERQQFPGSKFQQHTWQMHAMSAGIGPRGPFVLDLHGLSRAAARLALHNVSFCCCSALFLILFCKLLLLQF